VMIAIVALLAVSNFRWYLWQINGEEGTFSMARALPPCNGQVLVEGVTYHFRDPHRGEIVMFHARGALGSQITPDADSRDLQINKRVIGIPGDTVAGRNNRVYVNGRKADDIPTHPFPAVHLGAKQYFVMERQPQRLVRQPRLRAGAEGSDLRARHPDRVAARPRRRSAVRQDAEAARGSVRGRLERERSSDRENSDLDLWSELGGDVRERFGRRREEGRLRPERPRQRVVRAPVDRNGESRADQA